MCSNISCKSTKNTNVSREIEKKTEYVLVQSIIFMGFMTLSVKNVKMNNYIDAYKADLPEIKLKF